jgi:hypothetical protein
VTFNGTGPQTIKVANGISTSGLTFANLTIANTNAAVSAANSLSVSGTLTVNGMLIPSSSSVISGGFTLAGTGTIAVTHTGSSLGDLDAQYTLPNHGDGTYLNLTAPPAVTFSGAAAQYIDGWILYGTLTVNNPSGATICANANLGSSGSGSGTLTLRQGQLSESSNLWCWPGSTIVRGAGSLSEAPGLAAGLASVTYTGSNAVTTGPEIPTDPSALTNLTINNSAGVTLSASATVNGTLALKSGIVTTRSNILVVASTSSVAITGGNRSSYVNGFLQKAFATGSGQSFTFPIGDASNYTPLNLSALNVNTPGSLTAQSIGGQHPQIGSSTLNSSADVNRYWTLSNSPNGIVVSANTVTFNFASGDVESAANTTNFMVQGWNGASWTSLTTTRNTATSTTATEITSFGDFAVGDVAVAPGGAQCVVYNNGQAIINCAAIPGVSYTLMRSTNLTTWTNLITTNGPSAGVFNYIDNPAPTNNAYYQLRQH